MNPFLYVMFFFASMPFIFVWMAHLFDADINTNNRTNDDIERMFCAIFLSVLCAVFWPITMAVIAVFVIIKKWNKKIAKNFYQ